MPNWTDVLKEILVAGDAGDPSPLDSVRGKYLTALSDKTDRNVIAYYSGYLQKPNNLQSEINDDDKNGLMATIHNLDRSKGLDLLLHTPGGGTAATESLVDYLRQMFGTNIRCIIPQIAMSAGTMIACSCKVIIMGKQSNIGPIDPQFGGIPAHGVIAEFNKAVEEIKKDPSTTPLWQTIVGKYHPTFLGECQNAIQLSGQIVKDWLITGMLEEDDDRERVADNIVKCLNNHIDTKTHSRHIHIREAREMGLKISQIEDDFDDDFQDLVLTCHHAFMHTFANSNAIKIIENHTGQRVNTNINS